MSTVSIPPVSALDGEPCANCRAPLAGDQRYCLQCGVRRSDAPGTSLEALVAAGSPGIPQTPGTAIIASGAGHVQLAPAPLAGVTPVPVGGGGGGAAPPATPPGGASGFIRSIGPFISLASLAAGVLIIGLLIGHWSSDRTDPAPATTMTVNISGLGAVAAPAAAAPAAAATDSAAADDTATTPDAAAAAPPKDAVDASKLSAKDIEKAAKKGKAITTSGKKVAKDNKPAGGGSAFEEIG